MSLRIFDIINFLDDLEIGSLSDFDREFENTPHQEEFMWEYTENLRGWYDGVISPFAGKVVVSGPNFRHWCPDARRHFNVKTGTFLQGTKLPLLVWYRAIVVLCIERRPPNSVELSRILGITQCRAYYLMRKILTNWEGSGLEVRGLQESVLLRMSVGEKRVFADVARRSGMCMSVWMRYHLRRCAESDLEEYGIKADFSSPS